jgi:hypothetical protein
MQNSITTRTSSPSVSSHAALACAIIFCALPIIASAQYVQDQKTGQISALPATPPTSTAPATPAASAPLSATTTETPAHRPHRAEVTFNNGFLTVRANDSSLHQILSSISRQTGMVITGGVAEERVFGSYGPAEAGTIIATLLDGTGVNMLFKEGDSHVPLSLVLSPRGGAAAPPITPQEDTIGMDDPIPMAGSPSPQPTANSPAAPSAVRQAPQSQQVVAPATATGPPSSSQPANNVLGSPNNVTPTASQIQTTDSVPLDSLPTPSTTIQTQQGIVDTPNPPPPGTNATTPDQIYQQLLQLQQARAAAAAGTTTTPPPAPAPTTPPQ